MAPTPLPQNWTYSPDADVEALACAARARYRPRYTDGVARTLLFLEKLGNPHHRLPPVFHVAGTNGKGSTLAFLQAAFEAGGLRVHKYTSPHLIRFEERFTLGGARVEPGMLADLIREGMRAAGNDRVSFFEFFTGLMFLAASRVPADALLLETGLGGRLDATNVVRESTAILTRVSFDHMHILGDSLGKIAAEKAGIMRKGCPAIIAPQGDAAVVRAFEARAAATGAVLKIAGRDWRASPASAGFTYADERRSLALPSPALQGPHQVENAGSALAALASSRFSHLLDSDTLSRAMGAVRWPGRLQRLNAGPAVALLPKGWELWLDGAHNDSGAAALAAQAVLWGKDMPLHLVTAMKGNKEPARFYTPLAPHVAGARSVTASFGAPLLAPEVLCDHLRHAGIQDVAVAENLESAVKSLASQYPSPSRILITGSLYLAGFVLRDHG